MLFNSISYLVFFPIVLFVTFLLPSKIRYIWLLIASYYFYMNWNPKYICLIFGVTVTTYIFGLGIAFIKENNFLKNLLLILALILNFGLLFSFKYANFSLSNIMRILQRFQIEVDFPVFDIILPVGISFFIFQAVGYVIDIYRGDIKPEKNLLRYALFVSFFPQLVAGPIERSKNLLEQLRCPPRFKVKDVESGLLTISYGLFLKIVVSDNIATIIDPIFNSTSNYTGMQILYANILFAFQIYCDFDGYTQMAIGSAEIIGYKLNRNFNSPYLARGIKDFWKRWHISLTSWFRDYLYIPLGGNKKGNLRKEINTLLIFLCSGLWHGAAWKYVAWGGGTEFLV